LELLGLTNSEACEDAEVLTCSLLAPADACPKPLVWAEEFMQAEELWWVEEDAACTDEADEGKMDEGEAAAGVSPGTFFCPLPGAAGT
jgi:hypothetical protein